MRDYHGGIIKGLLSLTEGGEGDGGAERAVANQMNDFINDFPGGFFIYGADESEKILYANKALLKIFKCKTFQEFQTLTGGTFRGVVHPDDLDEVERSIAEQIKQSSDDMDYVEYRIVCKDGSVRFVEDYGHFAHTEWGDVFSVFVSDATEKINRRMQERLQRLEIIEGLSLNYDSILYFDLNNDTVLPYRLSSRMKEQFDENWGVRKYNELIKEYISAWVHPDDRASVREKLTPRYISSTLSEVPTYYFNYRCIQNGETIHLQMCIAKAGLNCSANKFVLGFRRVDEEILREIEQKRILEEALKSSKLAETAKNTFLANMSHDMRTPLNAIFGFSALARRNLDDKNSVADYLDRIDEAGKQILELTAKVLEASDTETQDFVIQEAPCNLAELIAEIFEATKKQAVKKNLLVSLETGGLLHPDVIADGGKIGNTLGYLTGNAVKYNKNGGRIQIALAEKEHSDKSMRTYLFSVADTGVGIDSDALERIFDPFEREKDTTESGVSGAGLGLTLARHNAERMGGAITVESVKGAGSTFTLTLNLKLAQTDESEGGETVAVNLAGLKVLLVEDNEINMEIATDMLQDAGFLVDTAENGKIAVEKIKSSPADKYDFVLMDIQMPVMDGRQAASEIRALGGKRAEIPVIALSANSFERDRRLSLEHGMNAHLTKPMDVDLIKKTVSEILSKRKK